MKNLKRVLSLALTGVMLVGMMAIGASAVDFTDGEDIVHTEAVNTMAALNIINGKDDGSFDPKATVTRAQDDHRRPERRRRSRSGHPDHPQVQRHRWPLGSEVH